MRYYFLAVTDSGAHGVGATAEEARAAAVDSHFCDYGEEDSPNLFIATFRFHGGFTAAERVAFDLLTDAKPPMPE